MNQVTEVKLIKEPETVMCWLKEHDIFIKLSQEDIVLLLNYLEGHDYAVGTDIEERLVRVDIATEEQKYEEYSVDEWIDSVCDWNYGLLLAAEHKMNNPKDMQEFIEAQEELERLKQDEAKLDVMFEQTKYGRDITELAEKMAKDIIANVEGAPLILTEGLKEHNLGKVR